MAFVISAARPGQALGCRGHKGIGNEATGDGVHRSHSASQPFHPEDSFPGGILFSTTSATSYKRLAWGLRWETLEKYPPEDTNVSLYLFQRRGPR